MRKKEELRLERERRERELDHAASVALELEPGGDRRCVVKVRQPNAISKADATVKFGLTADGGERARLFAFLCRNSNLVVDQTGSA